MGHSRQTPTEHVRVSLTVENPSFSRDFPQREIWLSVDDNKARIGRTSKVEAKGCLAAENNGWFDSPVMSRDHAEITADLHTRTLHITDLGSLHGTFLNGSQQRVENHEPYLIRDGDQVRFGVPIYRGPDTFPATVVTVGVHYSERAPEPVVFRPPLYLDDGECQEDVDDVAVTNVIDLTQNGPDRTLLIDLTSPASPQKQVGTLSPPRAAEMPTPAQGQAPGPNFDFNSPMTPGCHPSSSERGLAPQYGSDFELDPVPEPEQEQEPEHESELEPEQDQDLSIHLSDEGDDVDDCSSDEAEMWGYVSDGSMPDADHLESDLEDRSELGDTDEELPDDDDDDDLLSGFHYSDDDLDDYDEDTDSIVDDEQLLEATAVTYPLGQVLPNGQVDFSQPKFVQPDALHGGLVEVLQKPNACNISSLLNPDPRPASHTTVTTDPTPTTAAVLGHKTGKHEFFAAREENKLHFTQREHPVGYKVAPPLSTQPQREASHQQEPSHQQGPSHQQEPSRQPVSIEKPAAEGIPGAGPVGRSDYVQELAKSPLLDSGERFLNSPLVADSAPSQEPLIPGLDDILSAADFHQKKLLALEVAAAQTATKFKAVTILVNDDEPACPAPVPSSQRSKVQVLQEISHQAVKRKAADISTGDDAPVPPATQATSSTNERRILPAVGKTRGTDGEPPAKRNATEAAKKNAEREAGRRITRKGKGKAWQLVEKAGLVALGGAVVLGSLIYSAPTF